MASEQQPLLPTPLRQGLLDYEAQGKKEAASPYITQYVLSMAVFCRNIMARCGWSPCAASAIFFLRSHGSLSDPDALPAIPRAWG